MADEGRGFAARDLLRSERRRLERETTAYHMNESIPLRFLTPMADACGTALRPFWTAVLPACGRRTRNAILLRFFQNRPLAEVGSALGIAEAARNA